MLFADLRSKMADDGSQSGNRMLCPTRWTVRAEAMNSILTNYTLLQELCTWSVENYKDTEMKERIRWVQAHMNRFDFFFGLLLGECILQHSDSLSATLQKATLSAAEGHAIAAMTVRTLHNIRLNTTFDVFWQKATGEAEAKRVDEPTLPRQRRASARFEEGNDPPEYPTTYTKRSLQAAIP